MNKRTLVTATTAGILMIFALQTQACGEGQFNMGQGLQYQSYLAPRPASVLVYTDANGAAVTTHKDMMTGLKKAGHQVTEVSDDASFARALSEQRFDVVIADYRDADKVALSTASISSPPRILPIVERSQRNEPELRNRFRFYLLNGASLGQTLKTINLALPLSRK